MPAASVVNASFRTASTEPIALAASTTTYTRSGSDQLMEAALSSGLTLTPSYDQDHGDLISIASQGANYKISFDRDAHSRQVIRQTLFNTSSSETILTASIGYDPLGKRTYRTVSAGDIGSGSSTTNYWYGRSLCAGRGPGDLHIGLGCAKRSLHLCSA